MDDFDDLSDALEIIKQINQRFEELKPDKPEVGVRYRLIGPSDQPSIANGNTWEESIATEEPCPAELLN